MNVNNRVYACTLPAGVLAGANYAASFSIVRPRIKMKIKSILWDQEIRTVGGPPFIKLQNTLQTSQYTTITLAGTPGLIITDVFQNFLPIPAMSNGTEILLSMPGQYQFNSFYVSELLRIFWNIQNNDLLLTLNHFLSIVIETEEDFL